MTMYFDTLHDVISMNGHGAFVWGAYAISFTVLIALVVAPLRRTRRFLRDELRRHRRDSELTQDAADHRG